MWTDCERTSWRGEVITKTKHGEQCETETVAFDNGEGNTEFKLSDGIVDEDTVDGESLLHLSIIFLAANL